MDYLCEMTNDTARRNALKSLPPTLGATYERILRRINNSSKDAQLLVQRSLRWLMCSRLPLSIAALNEAVSINTGDTVLDHRAIPEEDEILRRCSSLVRVSASGTTLELAHFTVEEFLTAIDDVPQNEFSKYRVESKYDDLELAEACVTYLCFQDFAKIGIASEEQLNCRRKEYSFRSYAVNYWADHARLYLFHAGLSSLVQQLLHPTRPNIFLSWAQEYHKDSPLSHQLYRETIAETNARLSTATPLHYASILALPQICEWLLHNGCQVNHRSAFGTPLQCSLLGHDVLNPDEVTVQDNPFINYEHEGEQDRTIKILLDLGADPNVYHRTVMNNSSPLYLAATHCAWSVPCIELLRHGANVDDDFLQWINNGSDSGASIVFEILETIGKDNLRESDYAKFLSYALSFEWFDAKRLPKITGRSTDDTQNEAVDYHPSLRTAARFGQLLVLEELVNTYKLDVNSPGEDGETALHCAAASGHNEVVKFLLAQGADSASRDDEGLTVWHSAAEANNLQALNILWEFAAREQLSSCSPSKDKDLFIGRDGSQTPPLNNCHQPASSSLQTSLDGSSPLHVAARSGSFDAIRFLVDHGFDINAVLMDGSNALHCAVSGAGYLLSPEVVGLLCEKGIDPCKVRMDGMTPIHVLIQEGSHHYSVWTAVLQTLAKHAATLDQKNADGLSAVHQICQRTKRFSDDWGRLALQTLLDSGADPASLDPLGRTALRALLDFWESDLATHTRKSVDYARIITVILDRAKGVQALKNDFMDPRLLCLSIRCGDDDLSHKLLEQGHNVDSEVHSISKLSPIQTACKYGCSRPLLKTLLDRLKARLDAGELGSDLIRQACKGNNPTSQRIVMQLIQAGFDPNGCSSEGETSLMLAAEAGNVTILEALTHAGGKMSVADKNGRTVIHYACRGGHKDVVQKLSLMKAEYWNAKVKATVSTFQFEDATALHIAAASKDSCVLEYILSNNLIDDINVTTYHGVTALFVASLVGSYRNVSFLLSQKADETIAEALKGDFPLHAAAGNGHTEVVLTIIDHGGDTQVRNKHGLTPALLARRYGHLEVATILSRHAGGQGMHSTST